MRRTDWLKTSGGGNPGKRATFYDLIKAPPHAEYYILDGNSEFLFVIYYLFNLSFDGGGWGDFITFLGIIFTAKARHF